MHHWLKKSADCNRKVTETNKLQKETEYGQKMLLSHTADQPRALLLKLF